MTNGDETTRLVRWETVSAGGQAFDRTTVRTGWLQPGDDLAVVLGRHCVRWSDRVTWRF